MFDLIFPVILVIDVLNSDDNYDTISVTKTHEKFTEIETTMNYGYRSNRVTHIGDHNLYGSSGLTELFL